MFWNTSKYIIFRNGVQNGENLGFDSEMNEQQFLSAFDG